MSATATTEETRPIENTPTEKTKEDTNNDDDVKVKELVRLLEDYFSGGIANVACYEDVQSLQKLPLITVMNPKLELLVEAVRQCSKLNLGEDGKTISAANNGRDTLIFRELPPKTSVEDMKKLFEIEELNKLLSASVKQIKAELNETMFVSFASQEDCLAAAMWLRQHGEIKGQKVRFRVKSKLSASNASPRNPYTQQQGGYDYVQQMYYNMQQPYMQQYQYGQYSYYNNQNLPSAYQNQRGRRHSSGRGSGSGRGRGKKRNNNKNYNNNQRKPTRKRSNRGNNNEDEIFYGAKFTQVERTTFFQLTREAIAREGGEPICPEALRQITGLLAKKPKKEFEQKALQSLGTISPQIPPRGTPYGKSNPSDFDLNFNKRTSRNVDRKNKNRQQNQKGQNKKNHKKKNKPQKNVQKNDKSNTEKVETKPTETKAEEKAEKTIETTPSVVKKEPVVTIIHDEEQKEEEPNQQETAI